MKLNFRWVAMSACAATLCVPAMASYDIYVGYADGIRGGGFFPNPWDGSSGVTFLGGSGSGVYDAGAIMFVNTGATNMTLDPGVLVDNFNSGGTSFQLWDGMIGTGIVVAPGDKVILTQTSDYDFDTSDYSNASQATPSTYTPKVHFSIDGNSSVAVDTAQVLNTLGYDLASVRNESFSWRLIGTHGQPAPEPGTMAALGLGCAAMLRRRRKKA